MLLKIYCEMDCNSLMLLAKLYKIYLRKFCHMTHLDN